MCKCGNYEVRIPKESGAYSFYQDLKDNYGVTDAQIDANGHHVMNYEDPRRLPELEGDGDCIIDIEDAVELALNDMPRLRAPLERMLGFQVPWLLTDEGSAFPFDPEMKALSNEVVSSAKKLSAYVEELLVSRSIEKGSPEFKKAMATAMYALKQFPRLDIFNSFSESEKSSVSLIEDGLQEYGFKEVSEYLRKNGGLGRHVMDKEVPTQLVATGLETLLWGGGYGGKYLLYGIYKLAGLEPHIAEGGPTIDQGLLLENFNLSVPEFVGVDIGDGRLFKPGDTPTPEVYHPLSERHALKSILFGQLQSKAQGNVKQYDYYNEKFAELGNDPTSSACIQFFLLKADSMEEKKNLDAMVEKIKDNKSSLVCYFSIAWALLNSGESGKAYDLAKKMSRFDGSVAEITRELLKAVIRIKEGSFDKALDVLKDVHEEHPKEPHILYYLSWVYYLKDDFKEVKQVADELLALLDSAEAHYMRGIALAKEGDHAGAIKDLKAIFNPWNAVSAAYLIGWCEHQQGNPDSAGEIWAELFNVNEAEWIAQFPKEQIYMFYDQLSITADFPPPNDKRIFLDTYVRFAKIFSFFGDLTKAQDAMQKALALAGPDSDMEPVYYNLAMSCFRKGDTEKTLEYLIKAVLPKEGAR